MNRKGFTLIEATVALALVATLLLGLLAATRCIRHSRPVAAPELSPAARWGSVAAVLRRDLANASQLRSAGTWAQIETLACIAPADHSTPLLPVVVTYTAMRLGNRHWLVREQVARSEGADPAPCREPLCPDVLGVGITQPTVTALAQSRAIEVVLHLPSGQREEHAIVIR